MTKYLKNALREREETTGKRTVGEVNLKSLSKYFGHLKQCQLSNIGKIIRNWLFNCVKEIIVTCIDYKVRLSRVSTKKERYKTSTFDRKEE